MISYDNLSFSLWLTSLSVAKRFWNLCLQRNFVLFQITSGKGLRCIFFVVGSNESKGKKRWELWGLRLLRMESLSSLGQMVQVAGGCVEYRMSWGIVFPLIPEQLSSLCPKECPHIVFQAISGPLAAATASILTNPMDVIRTRVQVRPVFTSPHQISH